MTNSALVKMGGSGICLVAIVLIAVAFYWSSEPETFDTDSITKTEAERLQSPVVIGSATTSTLIHVLETILNKPGGYLSNDVTVPSVFMDDIPNWEYGALTQSRDLARAMRDNFSRSQSQSREDKDLTVAESRLNIDHSSWALPDAQTEYEDGIKHLRNYLDRLSGSDHTSAQFYARADNLSAWLAIVEARLGSLSQRLSASVGQRRLNTDLAGEKYAVQSTKGSREVIAKTPWLEIDDVFYEARGSTWALMHILQAIEKDFDKVLKDKNAAISLAQIIRELEASQQVVYSPMILNGSGFGLWANHSLVMASYISRANAALIDLRTLLTKG